MKNLKMKLATLGILATVVVSSTPVFAATNKSTSTAKAPVSIPSTIKASYDWIPGETMGTYVNFRTGPGTNYSIISVIANKYTFLNIDAGYNGPNGFARVMYNGRIGYIYSLYVAEGTNP